MHYPVTLQPLLHLPSSSPVFSLNMPHTAAEQQSQRPTKPFVWRFWTFPKGIAKVIGVLASVFNYLIRAKWKPTHEYQSSARHPLTVLDHAEGMLFTHPHMTVASTRTQSHRQNRKSALVSHRTNTHTPWTLLFLVLLQTNGHASGKETLLHTSPRSPPAALQRISSRYSETHCCCHGPQWMSGSD